MKVKDIRQVLKDDIEAMEEQMAYLEGAVTNDPGVDINDLASVEFINDLKDQSIYVDMELIHWDVPEIEFYKWVEAKGKDATIEVGDDVWWSPHAAGLLEEFLKGE